MNRLITMSTLLTSLTLICAPKSATAQDPAKASPTNYKVVLENDRVRVLEMRLHPGEKDNKHSHPSEIVYFVHPAKVKITLPDGETIDAELKKGHVMFHDAWTHTVQNVGTEELLAIIVELKEMP